MSGENPWPRRGKGNGWTGDGRLVRYFTLIAVLLLGFLLAAGAYGDVRLRFVVWDGDTNAQVLRGEVGKFEAAHPGIHVSFETVTANYQEKLLAQVAAQLSTFCPARRPLRAQPVLQVDARVRSFEVLQEPRRRPYPGWEAVRSPSRYRALRRRLLQQAPVP
jgi:hypothetical protein